MCVCVSVCVCVCVCVCLYVYWLNTCAKICKHIVHAHITHTNI